MSKIDSLSPEAAARAAQAVSPAGAGSARAKDNPTAVTPADKIELTSTALSLQKIDQELRGSASFDAKKVAEIKAAIANGTYRIDPEKVAQGLIDLERLLGRK